jgi:lipopolysaccharide/colanic/teichoic acid biosynthesis glycosyltransferase
MTGDVQGDQLMSSMASMFEPSPEPGHSAAALPQRAPDVLGPPANGYPLAKVVFEFLLALVLLILTAPLLLLAVILVKLTSHGPALYAQTRLGRHGQPFRLYKVRTMTHNCESLTGPCWSTPGDTRVTPIGRWLRRTHLDELPQLWNVLWGEMSLIGPRPERPEFVPQLEQALARYIDRLRVRPGVTGLAQVQLPPDTNLDSVRIKLAYDLYYIRHMSLVLDGRIYAATFLKMLGVPFALLRDLFLFPRRESVEAAYRALPPRSNPKMPTLVASCVAGRRESSVGEGAAGKSAG